MKLARKVFCGGFCRFIYAFVMILLKYFIRPMSKSVTLFSARFRTCQCRHRKNCKFFGLWLSHRDTRYINVLKTRYLTLTLKKFYMCK